jgi:hypothetical protein
MRSIDKTEHICKLCGSIQTVGGIRNHIQSKHKGYNTERYVSEFGEFRPKKLNLIQKSSESEFSCDECGKKVVSHKELMHHIRVHNMTFEEYHIKHKFDGKHPLCKCGCGSPVNILKSGVLDEKGNRIFAREFLSGHNTSMQVGVQTRSFESKMKMRESAIKRMEREGKRFSPQISSAQKEIYDYICNISDGFIEQDTTLLHGREVDIINHQKKIGIEYNGLYFHSDEYKDRKYHLSKIREMESLGYRLIYIWEDWWVRKKEIVKSMLSSILVGNTQRIYARNCHIQEISDEETRIFLHNNHIQGPSVSKIRIGLFYEHQLISVMTFGSLRKTLGTNAKDGHWEMMRFCSKLNTTVIGGASKLFSFFIKKYNPISVISYANRDWSRGNVYEKIGFNFVGMTEPGYFYAKGKRRFSRSQFTKHKLVSDGADKTKTESTIMKERGYMKIWDTGNLKYVWTRE